MDVPPILPADEDRETAPFFEAARNGKLVVRHCADCGNGIHPPTAHCPFCGGWNTHWREVSGRGRLHTWTTVVHQIHPAYPTPYTIVVVELDDMAHVRLVGQMAGAPELEAGMPMAVRFERRGDKVVIPQWERAG